MVRHRSEEKGVILPQGVTQDLINYWENLGFDLCFVPDVDFFDRRALSAWREPPDKFFFRLIAEGKLSPEAAKLSGHWLLVDGRDKPEKSRRWINRDEVKIFEKFGLPLGKILRWSKKQAYPNEFLTDALAALGAGSRFCLTIKEIGFLKPLVADFLDIPPAKIRLPTFAEYNFLGNFFYPQWSKTETWEWLQDQVGTRHLAGGSGSLGALGLDPSDYWSTILGFRLVADL